MIPYDKIFELVLFLIGVIYKSVDDKKKAIRKFRDMFEKMEAQNISADISEEVDDQIERLKKTQGPSTF